MQIMYKHLYDMNWFDRYLLRKLCAYFPSVNTGQTRIPILSHMSGGWFFLDFKMDDCRLKRWQFRKGQGGAPFECPMLMAPKYEANRSNPNCLWTWAWVHRAVRVGHIEGSLTSITLLFLPVFRCFPWTTNDWITKTTHSCILSRSAPS